MVTEKFLDFSKATSDSGYVNVAYNWLGNDITLTDIVSVTASSEYAVLARIDLQDSSQSNYIGRTGGYGKVTVSGLHSLRNAGNSQTTLFIFLMNSADPNAGGLKYVLTNNQVSDISYDSVFGLHPITTADAQNYRYLYVALSGLTSMTAPTQDLIINFDWVDSEVVKPYIPLTGVETTMASINKISDTDIAVTYVSLASTSGSSEGGGSYIFRMPVTDIPLDLWRRTDRGGKITVYNWRAVKSTYSWLSTALLELAYYHSSTGTWTKMAALDDGTWELPDLNEFPIITASSNYIGIIATNVSQSITISNISLAFSMWYDYAPAVIPEFDLHSYVNLSSARIPSPRCEINILKDKIVDVIKVYHGGVDLPDYLDLISIKVSDILPEYIDRTGGYPIAEITGLSDLINNVASPSTLNISLVKLDNNGNTHAVTSLFDKNVISINTDGTFPLVPLTSALISGNDEIQIYLNSFYEVPETVVNLQIKLFWVTTDFPDITPPHWDLTAGTGTVYPGIQNNTDSTTINITGWTTSSDQKILYGIAREDIDSKYINSGTGVMLVSGLEDIINAGWCTGINVVYEEGLSPITPESLVIGLPENGNITTDGIYQLDRILSKTDHLPDHGTIDIIVNECMPAAASDRSCNLLIKIFRPYVSGNEPYLNMTAGKFLPTTSTSPLNVILNDHYVILGKTLNNSTGSFFEVAAADIQNYYRTRLDGYGRVIIKGLEKIGTLDDTFSIVFNYTKDPTYKPTTRSDVFLLQNPSDQDVADQKFITSMTMTGSSSALANTVLPDFLIMYFDYVNTGPEVKKIRIGDTIPDSIILGNATVNPWKNEIWQAYLGDVLVWNKSKTFENCWLKWGIARAGSNTNGQRYEVGNVGQGTLELPRIVDLENWISSEEKYITWNTPIGDNTYWTDTILPWYAENDIVNLNGLNNLFLDSDAPGNLTVRVKFPDSISHPNGWSNYYFDRFMSKNMESVRIIWKSGAVLTMGRIFYGSGPMSSIEVDYSQAITSVKTPGRDDDGRNAFGICPVSMNMTFAENDCVNILNIPGFVWLGAVSSCRGLFSGNTSVHRWEDYRSDPTITTPHPTDEENVIRINSRNSSGQKWDTTTKTSGRTWSLDAGGTADMMFNGCTNLQYVGPIIDMTCSGPPNQMFVDCTALTSLYLNGLNNGDWDFTSGDLMLPELDQESITFMFSNLIDLHDYQRDGAVWKNFISQDHGRITIDPAWGDKVTDDLVYLARRRGWDVWKNSAQYFPAALTSVTGNMYINTVTKDDGSVVCMAEVWLSNSPAGSNITVSLPIRWTATGATETVGISIPRGHARGVFESAQAFTCTATVGSMLVVVREASDPVTNGYDITVKSGASYYADLAYTLKLTNNTSYAVEGRFNLFLTNSSTGKVQTVCNLLESLSGNSQRELTKSTRQSLEASTWFFDKAEAIMSGTTSNVYSTIQIYMDGKLIINQTIVPQTGLVQLNLLYTNLSLDTGKVHNFTGGVTYTL